MTDAETTIIRSAIDVLSRLIGPPKPRWVPVKERKPAVCDYVKAVWVAEKCGERGFRILLFAFNPNQWGSDVTHWWDGPDPWIGSPDSKGVS